LSRVPLSVVPQQQNSVACTSCGQCCTYIGVGINAPTRPRYATDVLWYLYHENVYVYVDGDGEWSVHFESRCRNLGDDLLCRIYAERPQICRGFDSRSCEVNDTAHRSLTFREPAEFLAWLVERRPRLYAKIAERFVPAALRQRPKARVERTRVRRAAREALGGEAGGRARSAR
jgi:Fe-S-cluster containining protein